LRRRQEKGVGVLRLSLCHSFPLMETDARIRELNGRQTTKLVVRGGLIGLRTQDERKCDRGKLQKLQSQG